MDNITYSQLNGTTVLPDGDVIAASSVPNNNATQIGIALSLGSGVTWWKGLQAGSIILDQCQGSQNYQETNITYSDFASNPFVLWKAASLGVHTAMYTVTDADSNMQAGYTYTFQWIKDSASSAKTAGSVKAAGGD